MGKSIALITILVLSLAPVGRAQTKEAKVFDFEPEPKDHFEQAAAATYVPEHVTRGKHALKADLKDKNFTLSWGWYAGTNVAGQWGTYDRFVIDVFVEGGAVKVYGLIRDEKTTGWDDRYNFEMMLRPGKQKLELPIGGIVREKDQKPLLLDKLTTAAIVFDSAEKDRPATIYLDNGRLEKGAAKFEVKVLYNFEGTDEGKMVLEDWPEEFKGQSKMEAVEEHATAGRKALKLESKATAGNVQFTPALQDWSDYDTLAIDLFNPSDKPVPVSGWIKTRPQDTWDQRYNWERVIRPGASTLKLSLGGFTNEGGKIVVDSSHVAVFNFATDKQTLFLDNVRLVKGTEEVAVEGLRKFDFGPKTSAVMPGFTPVSQADAYVAGKGFGWLPRGEFQRDSDIREALARHRPPDDLCRDFSQPVNASFQVDLPNGEYRGWLMMAPPGARIWTRHMKGRTVKAQGNVVLDQHYDAESFKKYEFQWQDAEDLPGDDVWERYRNSIFVPTVFDAAVTDGKLTLDFKGEDYLSSMVCGLVVWPKAQEAAAQKWLAGLTELRKEQFLAQHVETLPPAPEPYKAITAADEQRGYVRFIHSPDRVVQVNSVPTADEVATTTVALSAAPGEYQDACVGLHPLKDGGTFTATMTDLKADGGATIPASAVDVQLLRYKALNHNAVYTIEAKFLDKFPAEGLAIKKGVTRSIWLIAHVPADAQAGTYKGQLKLGAADAVEVSLTVWPIKLSEPKLPMGMFMTVPQGDYLALDTKEAYFQVWKEVLDDARAHGMTTVDPIIGAPLKEVRDGKAVIDFSDMDRFMDLAKAAGFTKELGGYAVNTGLGLRPGPIAEKDKLAQNYGLKTYGELVKAYFDTYREHAKAKGYLPIAFASNDEFLVHNGKITDCEDFHRVLKENASDFTFVSYDSIYPDERPAEIPAWTKMMKQVPAWGAGLHSPKLLEILKEAGSQLYLYNTGMNRFTFGTYMFRVQRDYGVKGFLQWVYPATGSYTAFDLIGHNEGHYGVVYPSTRGLRTTPTWERVRAGCNDHRYLQTAADLIEQSKQAGKGAAEASALQATIDATLKRLTFGKPGADAISGEGKAENPMDPKQMDAFRQAVAEGILKLQAAMQ